MKRAFSYIPFAVPFSEAHPEGRTAYRPLAKARITASNGRFLDTLVLPDSGADTCLFPLSFAVILRLDILNLPKAMTGGVGSLTNITYYDTLFIDLGDGIAFSAYAGFTQGMNSAGISLLGQAGFFDGFNVEFRHAEKIFTVETV